MRVKVPAAAAAGEQLADLAAIEVLDPEPKVGRLSEPDRDLDARPVARHEQRRSVDLEREARVLAPLPHDRGGQEREKERQQGRDRSGTPGFAPSQHASPSWEARHGVSAEPQFVPVGPSLAATRRRIVRPPIQRQTGARHRDTKEASMAETAIKGDRISVDSQKAGEPPRQGTVLEVIEHDYGASYRVAWDDGHETTFRPTAGTVHTVHPVDSKT